MPREVRSAYDIAQTTDANSRHWRNADGLSPRAANTPEIRKTIRERARYEVLENNSYGKGMVLTLANDTIGTGPRLQLRLNDREVNTKTEAQIAGWAAEVRLAEKLRSLRVCKAVDGEGFAHFTTNPLLRNQVKLDLALSEADHFTPPFASQFLLSRALDDGIEYDAAGNPVWYYRRKAHPGGDALFTMESEKLPASQVIHLFRIDRPGQRRGVSEISTALPLFAQLRRFTLATLTAAEFAASQNAVMETSGSAQVDPADVEALDSIPFEHGGLLTLPKGWKANQLKAEHPTTTYQMFKTQIIQEMARCLNMPFNVAAGDSSGYNYSSGRLDHKTYFKSIRVERHYWEVTCLDRIFLEWLREASLIPGYLPPELQQFGRLGILPPHEWFWDGDEDVDPQKSAAAAIMLRDAGLMTEAQYWASEGRDWERQHEQLERERQSREDRGIIAPLANVTELAKQGAEDDGEDKPARRAA
jgi:capsid protein